MLVLAVTVALETVPVVAVVVGLLVTVPVSVLEAVPVFVVSVDDEAGEVTLVDAIDSWDCTLESPVVVVLAAFPATAKGELPEER